MNKHSKQARADAQATLREARARLWFRWEG